MGTGNQFQIQTPMEETNMVEAIKIIIVVAVEEVVAVSEVEVEDEEITVVEDRMVEILTGVAIVAVATIEEETVVTEVDHVVANEEVALEGEGQEEVVS